VSCPTTMTQLGPRLSYEHVAEDPANQPQDEDLAYPMPPTYAQRRRYVGFASFLAAVAILATCAVVGFSQLTRMSQASGPISLAQESTAEVAGLEARAKPHAPIQRVSLSSSVARKLRSNPGSSMNLPTSPEAAAAAGTKGGEVRTVKFKQETSRDLTTQAVNDLADALANMDPNASALDEGASLNTTGNSTGNATKPKPAGPWWEKQPPSYPLPYAQGQWPQKYNYEGNFPNGFIWGMGTAAYQVEGAYREDGRGASIWDTFTGADTIGMPGSNCSYCCKKKPCKAHWAMKHQGATGNVAADHYNMYKTDVALMKSMGLKHYRFSLSWPRLIPTGKLKDGKNHKAIKFYKDLLDELKSAGITPYVTIYHWDLPQGLLDPPRVAGWWSRDKDGKPDGQIMADWLDFANLCFEEFGSRVEFWTTFNEPWSFLFLASGYGKAPSIDPYNDMTRDPWIGAHNVLNAHAEAVNLYRTKFQKKQKGTIGITVNSDWREPKTNKTMDIVAAEQVMLFTIGWFAEPIFGSTGDYPAEMRNVYGKQLPEFTEKQKALLKGSADFFGFNHYGTGWIAYDEQKPGADLTHAKLSEEGLPQGESTWLFGAAWGFRKALSWIKRRYSNPQLLVTEGGWSIAADTNAEAVRDVARINYYANYTSEMQKAIYEDGVDIRGYFAWSLLDNFEWEMGYKERFGTTYVDYKFGVDEQAPPGLGASHPMPGQQTRLRKGSSCFLEALWSRNQLVAPDAPDYMSCTSAREFHGEFKDSTQPSCVRWIEVHAPGTRVSMYGGCGKKPGSDAIATGALLGSAVIANFSAGGGPSRLHGFWSSGTNSIVWGDGSVWTKRAIEKDNKIELAFRK